MYLGRADISSFHLRLDTILFRFISLRTTRSGLDDRLTPASNSSSTPLDLAVSLPPSNTITAILTRHRHCDPDSPSLPHSTTLTPDPLLPHPFLLRFPSTKQADTPGCTNQACGFRDHLSEITQAGYDIYGLSKDKPAALKRVRLFPFLHFTTSNIGYHLRAKLMDLVEDQEGIELYSTFGS